MPSRFPVILRLERINMKNLPVFETYDISTDDGYSTADNNPEAFKLLKEMYFFCLENKTNTFLFRNTATGAQAPMQIDLKAIRKYLKMRNQLN